MIDFMFSLVLGGAFIALLYGVIVMFARWREAWRLRADFDPLLGYELHPRIERFLAAADFAASRLHYSSEVADQKTEHLLLQREIEKFRREAESPQKPTPPDHP